MNETVLGIVVNIMSSVIYDAVLLVLKSGMNALIQKKLQQQVSDKVHAELEKLVEEGLLFQGAAFVDYVNHMQPIQKIVRWVMEPEKHYGRTEKEFLASVLEDTIRYLKAHDMNVGIPECNLLEEFYSRLLQISREVLYSYMDTSDRALGDMIQQVIEAGEKRAALEIQNAEKRLGYQADQNKYAIQSQINLLMTGMPGTLNSSVPLILRNFSTECAMPYKYQQGSDKRELIQQVTSNLYSHLWIHIYGTMFAGKTQALIRVAERLGSYLWVSVEERSFLEIQLEESSLEEDAVIILDGIPNIANSGVREKCLQLLGECRKRKCRFITSGYENIAPYLKGYVRTEELVCVEISGFTADEVDEIAESHGAPAQLLHTKGYQNFVELCKSMPPVVMEVIHRMEDNGWQFDDEVFMAILQRRTDTLTEQMITLFQESVREEETRHLYYRMIYAGQTIPAEWLRPIAEIPQRIPDMDMRIEKLRNRWYYKEGKVYQSPNTILEQYAEEQLGKAEKDQINRFLANETMKHPLDEMDVTNLFKYYGRLEEYDAEGILCVQLLENMVQKEVKDYFVHPENFWTGIPFPEKMSPLLKCQVRLEQAYYKAWKGDKDPIGTLDVEWLWAIATEEPMCRELIIVQFIRLAMVCADTSLKLFQEVIDKHPEYLQWDEEFRQKLELEDRDNILCDRSLFVAYNEMLCLNVKNMEQLEMYVACMEQYFTQEQWQELEQEEDMEAVLFHMLSKVAGVNEPKVTECSNLIGRFCKLLDHRKTPRIWRSVLHFYLVQLQTEEGYQKTWEIYRSIQPVLEEQPVLFCEIIDTMARIAHDNKDEEHEKQMFGWEMDIIPQLEDGDTNSVMVGSCLLYLDKLTAEDLEEVEKVHSVLQHIAGHICPAEDFPYISEKLEAAYWMKIWQLGLLNRKMRSFILFVRELLEAYDTKSEVPLRAILTKMVHVLGYISGVLIRRKAPDKTDDGSDYASPSPHMFWNSVNENDVVQYWKPSKREMAYYICSELEEQCGETDLASELFAKMLCKVDFWTNNIMYLYRVDAYMELKILECERLDRFLYVMTENYRERTLPQKEQESEFLWVNREIMILSLYILQLYRQDKRQGLDYCKKFLEALRETEFGLIPRTYYQEYRKILKLVIEEDADFELLKYAFFQIQKRAELVNMDSAVFPLLQLEAPIEHMDMLKRNLRNAVKTLKLEEDFMVMRMI